MRIFRARRGVGKTGLQADPTAPAASLVIDHFRIALLYHRTYELGPEHDWVVFVHGAGGSSAVWYRQIRDFKEHFNVLLVDLRGHGGSQQLSPTEALTYSFEDVSRDILEVMDHLGIERAHFVGISLGSILIRTLGEMAPERVKTVVLGGAIARLNARSRLLVALGNAFKRVVPFMWLYRLFAWIIMPRRRHRESRLLFVGEAKRLCRKEFLRWFRMTHEVNPLLRLFEEKELPRPTLYLMGAEDYMFLPAVRAIIRRHRNSLLRVIEGAGHVCNVEAPAFFNRHAIAFIQAHR